jgi:hypothetical protein
LRLFPTPRRSARFRLNACSRDRSFFTTEAPARLVAIYSNWGF